MLEAVYVLTVARGTGWSEDFIRWSLPQERGWAYFHAARLLDGAPMRWPGRDPERTGWWQRAVRSVEGVRRRWQRARAAAGSGG